MTIADQSYGSTPVYGRDNQLSSDPYHAVYVLGAPDGPRDDHREYRGLGPGPHRLAQRVCNLRWRTQQLWP